MNGAARLRGEQGRRVQPGATVDFVLFDGGEGQRDAFAGAAGFGRAVVHTQAAHAHAAAGGRKLQGVADAHAAGRRGAGDHRADAG